MGEQNYFFDLSRKECEDLLQNKNNGTFLVRRSESNRNNFVLVVNWNGRAHHYKILQHERNFFLEAAKGVSVVYFSDLDALIIYYKKNKMTATNRDYILVQPVSEAQPNRNEGDEEEEEEEDWDYDDVEDNITPFFQQQLNTIKSRRDDEAFTDMLKEYIEKSLLKDFQCVNQGTCKAPFVQQLLVTAASDLHAALESYLKKLNIMHELFNIGRNINDTNDHQNEEDYSHDIDSILKMLKNCKDSMHNVEKKDFYHEALSRSRFFVELPSSPALEVFHDFSPQKERDSKLLTEDSIDNEQFDTIYTISEKAVKVQTGDKPQNQQPPLKPKTPEFEVTVGPLRSKNFIKIDVIEGKVLITKSGNDKPDVYPIDQILQLAKSKSSSKNLKVKIGIGKDVTTKSFNFINYMSRELFCQTIQQVKVAHSNDPKSSELTVFVGTWNMGTSNVSDDITSWFKCIGSGKTNNSLLEYGNIASDLYAFGTQESAYYEKEWTTRLRNDLQKTYNRVFKLVVSSSLWGIRIVIFVKAELLPQVNSIKQSSVKTGIANALGNKGAIAVSFNIGMTSYCFVNAHLTSGTEKLKRRNQNYLDILRGLSLGQEEGFDITLAFHHVFWMGDLNYRLELEEKDIPMIIKLRMHGDLQGLLDHDQLLTEMKNKRVFVGFEESELQFPPTYKYMKGDRSMYDWKKEKRTEIRINVPSWCDRVLWKSYPGVSSLNLTYGCSDTIFTSDHSPVFATFNVGVVSPKTSSTMEQKCVDDEMYLIFNWVEAKILTRSSSKFVLTFTSNCLEKQVVSKQNSVDNCKRQQDSLMRRAGTSDVAAHNSYPWWTKGDIPCLKPVLRDPYYLEAQHLLIAVKGDDEQESYGECVVSLKTFLSGGEKTVECQLTHLGLETGSLLFCATMNLPKNLSYQPSIQKDIYSLIKMEDDEETGTKRTKTMEQPTFKKDIKLVQLPLVDRSSIQQVDPRNKVVESSRHSIGDVLKRQSLGFDNFALSLPTDPQKPPPPVEKNWQHSRDDSCPPPPPMRLSSIDGTDDNPRLPPKNRLTPSTSSDGSHGSRSPTSRGQTLPAYFKHPEQTHLLDDEDGPPPIPKPRTHRKVKKDVKNWLTSIKCEQYYDLLVSNGYDDLSFYHELSEEDLQEIGITKQVDRIQILSHAQVLKKKPHGLVKV